MNLEPTPSVPRSSRPRRTVRNLVIAVIAIIPIAACSSGADDPTAADTAEPTMPARPTDEPSPTATVTVTSVAPARALFGTPGGRLESGTYFVDKFDGTRTARVHVTLGPGWAIDFDGWSISNSNGGYFTFNRPDAVLSDACHPSDGYHPGPMTTLDGLVAALSEQKGWAEVTTPSDISVDGYTGKAFQRTSPTDFDDCTRGYTSPGDLPYPMFPSWEWDDGAGGWSYYEEDTIETLWVLDLDGTIVILSMRAAADEPAATHAELAAVLDSIRIDRE